MNPAVLIVDEDADNLAQLLSESDGPAVPVIAARDAAAAKAAYADQQILFGSPGLISGVLADMPSVKWVQSTWAGVTPLLKLERRDYVLTIIKDVFGPQMSEYVIGHLLAHELKLAKRLEEQRARRWFAEQSGTLFGKRMGIMGTGSIGRAIGERATTFDVTVTGLSRSGQPVPGFEKVFPVDRIDEFLPRLDYLVGVLPDTTATNDLLDESTLSCLPAHAVFINVGRANVVNDDALVAALNNGKLGAAILDVFDEEPVPGDSPLWNAPNLVMTGHTAAISHPELIVPIFLENYRRFTAEKELVYVLDFGQGY
jgi:phosphoglycerate dehydrogenase-like enzyme